MNYDTSFGDELYSDLINKSKTFKLLHDFIYGEKFMKMFLDLFSKDIEDEIKNSFLKIDIKNTPLRVQSYEVNGIISKHDFKKKKDRFMRIKVIVRRPPGIGRYQTQKNHEEKYFS